MRNFCRENPLFSLCGLNCGLCQLYVGRYCPGCGGGEGNRACAMARCALERGVEYCFLCDQYPCARYDGVDAYDSILPHRNRRADAARAKQIGIAAYTAELTERMEALNRLLADYNDGRRKSFYLTAVYLLDWETVKAVLAALPAQDVPLPERAATAVALFRAAAERQGVELALHKKPKKA